jgi:uncharacterized membrane protein
MAKMYDVITWVIFDVVLALIPIGLAYLLAWMVKRPGSKLPMARVGIVAIGIIWLAMMPNTCYLLTEWRHFFRELQGYGLLPRIILYWDTEAIMTLIRLWFFYIAFSLIGVMSFTLAIRPVHKLLVKRVPMWVIGPPFFFLMSLGVYLGWALRFFTWDIVLKPGAVFSTIMQVFQRQHLPALIIGFAICLWVLYLITDIWVDGFQMRLRRNAVPGAPQGG